ncbi:hypothetical protein HII31_09513 [Pseudocercospora fuligena]|uniref:Uncharacterized protein n=1 Tax=Pseudocercospora fuligena TaxID=685502 RepID=A0A8H6RAN6_9PEZI|nr:hypothetical protein HII31_09513 [Pseudocercospora fuligena]
MAKDAPSRRVFPNLGRREKSEEEEDLTSTAPTEDGENAHTLLTSSTNDAAQEERETSSDEDESTAAAVSSSIPSASIAFNPLDPNRGADPTLAGDLFAIAPTRLEDNMLFGTLGRNQAAKLFDHEEILRMASRHTIAQMAAMYQKKHGEEVANKRISVRLDTAKDKVAAARGCLRKDIVAAFEEEKRKYGVEKAKNMEAGRKRKAQKQAAAAAKPPIKKRKRSSIPKPQPQQDEDSDVDDFAALEERLPEHSDDEVAEMVRQEQRGVLKVKEFVSKKAGKKRKRSPSPEPEPEEDDKESLPEYSDEEMAEMARKAKEEPAKNSEDEQIQSSSPPVPQHLQRGAVERGEYTEEHAADALMMLSHEARRALAQPEDNVDAEGEEVEE